MMESEQTTTPTAASRTAAVTSGPKTRQCSVEVTGRANDNSPRM